MRRFFLLMLAYVCAGFVLEAQNPASFRKQPYLLPDGTTEGMLVVWQTHQNQSCQVQWGTDSTQLTHSAQVSAYGDHQYKYRFTSLTAGTHYYYRVICAQDTVRGDFYSGPQTADSFTFYAYGDTRSQPHIHDQVAGAIYQNMTADPAAQTFLVNSGDLVEDGDDEDDWDQQFFAADMTHLRRLMRRLPYLSAVGNHEGSGVLFAKYFPYPMMADGTNYYSFDYGHVHFTVIDQYDDYSPGSTQYNWIRQDLENTTQPWKIILMHKPAWSAGGHSNSRSTQNYLVPLFEQNGVSLVINGHNHYYARAENNNITYLTTGGGGAPLYDPDPSYPHVITVDRSYHFLKIHILNDRELHVEAIRADGSSIESFNVTNNNVLVQTVRRDDHIRLATGKGRVVVTNLYDHPVTVKVYGLTGRRLAAFRLMPGRETVRLKAGVYLLHIRLAPERILVTKLLIP